jgi:hypothetical protein
VHAAAERERFDDLAVGQGPGQHAALGVLHPDADGDLSKRLVHRQDCAQPPDYLARMLVAHGSELTPTRPPPQCLRPRDGELGISC